MNSDKKLVEPHFGRFLSQTHLVTLLPNEVEWKLEDVKGRLLAASR
jgi:hypothetical protein